MGEDSLEVKISSLKLKNPVVFASGCLEYDESLTGLVPINEAGAFITKTITLRERLGNPMPRTCEVKSGLINSIGLQNKGLEHYLKYTLPFIEKHVHTCIITSISGFTIEEFAELASRLDKDKRISAIEVNISCPNLERHEEGEVSVFAQDEYLSYGVVKAVRESTGKPVIVKLSPEVTEIKNIARAVYDAGCDALTVANTYTAMAVDIECRRPKIGNVFGGLSGPVIKPLTLKRVWDIRNSLDIPVIASGGIMDSQDALEYIIAGATMVSLGTANFVDPAAVLNVINGIKKYLAAKDLRYEQLIGSLKLD